MNKEEFENKVKSIFPENVELITISKNDYDRLYGELTYKNIILQKRIDKAIEYINNNQLVFSRSTKEQINEWFSEFYKDLLQLLKGEE